MYLNDRLSRTGITLERLDRRLRSSRTERAAEAVCFRVNVRGKRQFRRATPLRSASRFANLAWKPTAAQSPCTPADISRTSWDVPAHLAELGPKGFLTALDLFEALPIAVEPEVDILRAGHPLATELKFYEHANRDEHGNSVPHQLRAARAFIAKSLSRLPQDTIDEAWRLAYLIVASRYVAFVH